MENVIEALLTLYDVLTSKTAKDFYAGAVTIVMAVIVAELILGMF